MFDYDTARDKVKKALEEGLRPDAYIGTGPGYGGRVQVKVVSPEFDGLTEEQKQDKVWELVRNRLGADSQSISFILVYGNDEPDDPSFEEAHNLAQHD